MQIRVDKRGLKTAEAVVKRGGDAFAKATRAAGFELRGKMKEGIQAQAPGGEAWPPPHPWTKYGSLRNVFAWRRSGGKRTWSATRYIRQRRRMSITGDKKPLARLAGAVRVRQDASGGLGSQGGQVKVRIGFLGRRGGYLAGYHAEAHRQPVTARMRRFLFAAGLGVRAMPLQIPARPIVPPVHRRYGPLVPGFIRSRVAAAIAGNSARDTKL